MAFLKLSEPTNKKMYQKRKFTSDLNSYFVMDFQMFYKKGESTYKLDSHFSIN